MNHVGFQIADLDKVFDSCDCDASGRGHNRIEISGSLPIDEIAPLVALPCFDECKIGLETTFQDVHPAVEFTCFLALGHNSSITRRRKEPGNTRAPGAHSFGKRALRNKLDFELSG